MAIRRQNRLPTDGNAGLQITANHRLILGQVLCMMRVTPIRLSVKRINYDNLGRSKLQNVSQKGLSSNSTIPNRLVVPASAGKWDEFVRLGRPNFRLKAGLRTKWDSRTARTSQPTCSRLGLFSLLPKPANRKDPSGQGNPSADLVAIRHDSTEASSVVKRT